MWRFPPTNFSGWKNLHLFQGDSRFCWCSCSTDFTRWAAWSLKAAAGPTRLKTFHQKTRRDNNRTHFLGAIEDFRFQIPQFQIDCHASLRYVFFLLLLRPRPAIAAFPIIIDRFGGQTFLNNLCFERVETKETSWSHWSLMQKYRQECIIMVSCGEESTLRQVGAPLCWFWASSAQKE